MLSSLDHWNHKILSENFDDQLYQIEEESTNSDDKSVYEEVFRHS